MNRTQRKRGLEALQTILIIVGGQRALGRKLGISQGTIWNWLHTTKKVPAERVIQLEKAVKGTVRREDIRPDLYPDG